MKYFTYNLKPISPGEAIGPSVLLPEDSKTGYQILGDPYVYYGAAEIGSLDILKEYNALEITEEQFNAVYSPPVPPSGSGSV